MHRAYLPNLRDTVLTGDEAHHCLHVLRLKVGDTVTTFDGKGHEAHCRITAVAGDSVTLAILQQSATPPLRCRITLAQAVPKKSMDLIVQKATELGAASIVPLLSERTIVQLDDDSKKVERWRNIALESCKQCGNNWLPEVLAPQKAARFLADPGTFDLKLIASLQPDSKPLKHILATGGWARVCRGNTTCGVSSDSAPDPAQGATPPRGLQSVLLLIGPEGDFTPAELAAAKSAGCLPLSLGPLVLRAETAAMYALSILHHELQVG